MVKCKTKDIRTESFGEDGIDVPLSNKYNNKRFGVGFDNLVVAYDRNKPAYDTREQDEQGIGKCYQEVAEFARLRKNALRERPDRTPKKYLDFSYAQLFSLKESELVQVIGELSEGKSRVFTPEQIQTLIGKAKILLRVGDLKKRTQELKERLAKEEEECPDVEPMELDVLMKAPKERVLLPGVLEAPIKYEPNPAYVPDETDPIFDADFDAYGFLDPSMQMELFDAP
jgi:hypothetical protein